MSTNTPRKHLRWLAGRLQAYAQNCERKAAAGQLKNPGNLYRGLFWWQDNGWAANDLVMEALRNIGLEGARKGKNGNVVVYQKSGPTPELVPNQLPLMRALLAAGVPPMDAYQAWDVPTEQCLEVLDTLINQHVKPPDADTGRTIFDCLIEALKKLNETHRGKRYTDAEREGFRRDIAVALGNAPHATDAALAKRLGLPRSSFKCLKLNTFAAKVRQQYCSNPPRLKRGQRKVDVPAEAPEDAE